MNREWAHEVMRNKKIIYLTGLLLLANGVNGKTPSTQAVVTRPTTQTSVSHPGTVSESAHPVTAVSVSHPTTQIPVLKPATTTTVNQLTTQVAVTHPQTPQTATHPNSSSFTEIAVTSPAGGDKGTATSASAAASSASTQTSMSGFQMPKAKDFTAGPTTGMGTPNDEEKRAEAEATQKLKPKEASMEALMGDFNAMKQSMQGKVEQDVSQKVGGK